MPASRSDKVKKMMGNFVGASASVAVVAAVASFSISVEANFIDVTVFQNRAFYQLEVREIVEIEGSGELPEDAPEPVNTPVRLRVQNQWDDFSIPLIYGFNEGFIEPLRADQQYTLTIELQQAIGWSALDTRIFNTAPETAAVISDILETTSPLNPLTSLTIHAFTQDGGVPATSWDLVLTYGDVEETRPLLVGDNSITFNDLPHVNAPIDVAIIATFEDGPRTIRTRQVQPTEFLDASFDLSFPTLTTLAINTKQDTSFLNGFYSVRLTENETTPLTYPMTDLDLIIENLTQGVSYHVEWLFTYTLPTGQTKTIVLHEQTVLPIVTPIYVLTINDIEGGQALTLTIDRDLELDAVSWQGVHDGNDVSLSFNEISTTDSASTFTLETNFTFALNSVWTLVITQASPYDYPITLQTIIFQGGNAR
jgi:hypothetical protein